METLILTLHIIVCVLLVILILLQAGKEGMGVIFGGGGNTSVFGSSGAGGILAKLTAFMAVVFVITSLSYTYVSSPRAASEESQILSTPAVNIEDSIPAQPAAPAAPAGTDSAASAPAVEKAPAAQPAAPAPSGDAPAPAAAAPEAPATAQ
ncbi:preprotein translocase subunit SecG [uncultured Desulfovibrio sp.]|uniref:preprotein translocase subunit SecG n=1 Tax=uncultured Desulfovibrio sp. TaxID=167968 RepID=UPI00262B025A|nr:preprotein translocase subunit SecG [uncultured Desulfovibrio sp.]